MNYLDLLTIGPELLLVCFCLFSLLVASFYDSLKSSNIILSATIVVLVFLALLIYLSPYNANPAFRGAFVRDHFAQYFHLQHLEADFLYLC